MTKGRALANLSDCHDQTDMRTVEDAVHTCVCLGCKPWDIKKTLRDSMIPFFSLSAGTQGRLSGSNL